MSEKVRVLVLQAVNECGRDSVENVLSGIEEQLTLKEAKDVRTFLKWAFFDWDTRGFGHGNFDKQWRKCFASEPSCKIYRGKKSNVMDMCGCDCPNVCPEGSIALTKYGIIKSPVLVQKKKFSPKRVASKAEGTLAKEIASQRKMLKLLVKYYDAVNYALERERLGHNQGWDIVQKTADEIEDEYDFSEYRVEL
jgi:hypothetical protein